MKTEWLVADVAAVRSPDRAEHAKYFWGDLSLAFFFANSGYFCDRRGMFRYRNPLLSNNNFTQRHLMKTGWLVTDVKAVGSPDRAERAILGMILAWRPFGQFRLYL